MIEVTIVGEDLFESWDDFVAKTPSAGFFHRTGWLKVIEKTYGHRSQYLMAVDDGQVVGVLPLFLISIPFLGCYLASDVFTSYGGVSATDPAVSHRILAESERLAVQHNAAYVEVKNSSDISCPGTAWHTKDSYCTMILDLQDGAENIWDNWMGKNRTNVRKAKKSSITIRSGPDQIDDFYEMASINMRLLGTPVHSRHFYENILEEFPNDANLHIARYEDRAVAGVLTLGYKEIYQAFAAVALPEYRHLKPTSLLYWEVIQKACAAGYTALDFGRSTWDSGTFKFKRQLGAEPVPLYYEYFLHRQAEVPEIHQNNKKFQFAIRTWQHLPLGITKLLGPQLIKYVA
jgi:FemAB-related protein (PEP-CTERM system-associated)